MKKVKYDDNLAPEIRNKSIGGSDSATIMGANKYQSAVELWLEKTGQKERDNLDGNEFIYWGKKLEDIVAQEFEERTKKKVRRNNFVLYSDEYPFLSANLDREVTGEKAVLECKTTNAYAWREWEDDNIPLAYIYQVMHYLLVTGMQYGYIAVLIGGNKFAWKRIDRDEELISFMLEKYKKFWECVETKTMPEIESYSEITSDTVKALYPESKEGSSIDLSAHEDLLDRISIKKTMIKEQQDDLDSFENELKMLIQDNEIATCRDRYVVTYKTVNQERFDTKSFKTDNPNLASKYLKSSSYRKLNIKKIEG